MRYKIAILNKETGERGEFDVPLSSIVFLKKFAREYYKDQPTAWLDIYAIDCMGKYHWRTGFILNPSGG